MTSDIKVYEHPDFGGVRTVVVDGKTLFVASDIAKNLAYVKTADMTRLLPDDEKGWANLPTAGGEQKVAVLTEAGLYRACVTRTTAYIKDPVVRERVEAFQHWILHEVLPGIRETGYYLNVPPEQLGGADLDRLTAYTMAALEARLKAFEEKVAEMRPKAELADAMLGSEDTILVRELAQLLTQAGFSIGAIDLFKLLREEGFLIKAKTRDENAPTRRSIEMGLFEVRETVIEYGGRKHIKRTPRVTPEGQRYFVDRYVKNRKLPELGGGDAS